MIVGLSASTVPIDLSMLSFLWVWTVSTNFYVSHKGMMCTYSCSNSLRRRRRQCNGREVSSLTLISPNLWVIIEFYIKRLVVSCKERSRSRGKLNLHCLVVGSSNFWKKILCVFNFYICQILGSVVRIFTFEVSLFLIILIYVRSWVGSLVTLWHFIHFNKFVEYYRGVKQPLLSPNLIIICYFLFDSLRVKCWSLSLDCE